MFDATDHYVITIGRQYLRMVTDVEGSRGGPWTVVGQQIGHAQRFTEEEAQAMYDKLTTDLSPQELKKKPLGIWHIRVEAVRAR